MKQKHFQFQFVSSQKGRRLSTTNGDGTNDCYTRQKKKREEEEEEEEEEDRDPPFPPPRHALLLHMRFEPSSGPFSLTHPSSSFTSSRQRGTNQYHRYSPNCLCCVGQPDPSFERAVEGLTKLSSSVSGGLSASIDRAVAESFVRMCRQSTNGMRLSKAKVKAATKLKAATATKGGGGGGERFLTTEDVEKMQECVLKAYEETLRLEKEGKMTKDE